MAEGIPHNLLQATCDAQGTETTVLSIIQKNSGSCTFANSRVFLLPCTDHIRPKIINGFIYNLCVKHTTYTYSLRCCSLLRTTEENCVVQVIICRKTPYAYNNCTNRKTSYNKALSKRCIDRTYVKILAHKKSNKSTHQRQSQNNLARGFCPQCRKISHEPHHVTFKRGSRKYLRFLQPPLRFGANHPLQ